MNATKKNKPVIVRVDQATHKRLRVYCAEHETTTADLFRQFLQGLFNKSAGRRRPETAQQEV